MNLKLELEQIDLNHSSVNLDALIEEMVLQIGSTDPVLRDELIYTTFGKLVMEDHLSESQLTRLLSTCLDENHLFYHIGEKGTDTVFTRSFSVLVIELLLKKDREKRFLKNEQVNDTINACCRYLREEKDTRGFVEGKGWAHSIAHGADALTEAVKHPVYHTESLPKCLDVLETCLFKEAVYVDDEDERLLFVVEALLEKGMREERLIQGINELHQRLASLFEEKGYCVESFHMKRNVLGFLKSCYFRLLIRNKCPEARGVIGEIVERWTRKIYIGE
ncbi:DUF2785 domain-containing protein [Bacillus sp. RAR_GA_16]|uniref:DUF2785 domain-containing protein n=1 Tax=Bacillus sp. RAR_GA_16 TaxID=2876774 RepID=UPI001CCBB192|nr:DUF2785 domain-containing protein [Bacillus sp. RAR_GA_16]MCA0172640.1 DUF2785 domain-containing protein [Bacillus sp. RAR_GA_16]